jgi:hypothetical protein
VRRLLIAIAVAFLGMGLSSALAKPKVVVTVAGGDSGDRMGEAVREILDGKLAVVAPRDVERAMSKLDLSGALEDDELRRLRQRLDAAVVVQGKLGRSGKKKTVRLTVAVRGKRPSAFTVQYKSVGSEKFRDTVRDALLKRIGSIDDLEDGEDRPKKKKKKKLASADDDDDDDDDRPRTRKRKRASDDDDDDDDDDDEGDGEGVRERPARPLPAARVDAGFSYGARYLTYKIASDSPMRPPKVLTPAPSGRFEGELYPLALSNPSSPLAGLGIFGEYDKTIGLSIEVPNTMGKSTPINQAHYSIGVRYRLPLGRSAISAGVAYARRHYIADRSSLDQPTQLDAPDVDYAAVAPVIGARTQVASRIALFAEIDAMLVLSAGSIVESENYGGGDVFGIGGNVGVDIALGKQIGLRFAAEYNQMNLSFGGTGTMASVRKVSGATDRDFGGSATFAAMF